MEELFGTISPILLLCIAAVITVAGWGCVRWQRRRRNALMATLPAELGMQFSPTDRFDLASAVAAKLAPTGAADVEISDVLYTACSESFRYVFTVHYTVGALRRRRRVCRIMSLCESRSAGGSPTWGEMLEVDSCDGGVSQYRKAAAATPA